MTWVSMINIIFLNDGCHMLILIRKIHLPYKGHGCLFNANWIRKYKNHSLERFPLFTYKFYKQ